MKRADLLQWSIDTCTFRVRIDEDHNILFSLSHVSLFSHGISMSHINIIYYAQFISSVGDERERGKEKIDARENNF